MNEQELNGKLAEWAGLPIRHDYEPCGVAGIQTCRLCGAVKPAIFKDCNVPNFTQSLDACFKWLLPKLEREDGYLGFYNCFVGDKHEPIGWSVHIDFLYPDKREAYAHNMNLALAICLAIEKLISEE